MVRQWIANPLPPVRIWVPPADKVYKVAFFSFNCRIGSMGKCEKIRGRGGIGRHDGLKIRCLVIVREGSSPSVPIIRL